MMPDAEHPVGMCIITVDDGPSGERYALVAVSADLRGRPGDVRRRRAVSTELILKQVRAFLLEAGLADGPAPARADKHGDGNVTITS